MSKTMNERTPHHARGRNRPLRPRPSTARLLRSHALPALVVSVCALTGLAHAAPDPLAGRVEQLAQERGASSQQLAEKHGKIAKNGAASLSLKLAPKQCVVAAASGEDALPDLSLSLEIKDGPALSDETNGPSASLRYCAGGAEEKLNVRVRSEQATRFSLGVWSVATGQPAAPAASSPDAPAEQAATPVLSLGKRLQKLVASSAPGFDAMTPPREEDVSAQEARKREVVLATDQCYRLLAVSESPSTEIELTLADAKGAVQSSGRAKSDLRVPATASFCPTTGGAHTVTVRALAGTSRVSWQLLGETNPELGARFPVGGTGNELVATRMRDIHRNQGAKAPVMAFESGQLGTAEVHTSSFDVVGGRCYLAVAEGVPSLRELSLELADHRGHTVARSQEQSSINMLRFCADLSGRWTVRAKAFKGYGAFGVQVFLAPTQR